MAYFERHILAKWTSGEWINDRSSNKIQGFSIDSRRVDQKEMFIALKSDVRDGHAFVADAEKRGATAALTEQCVGGANIPQLKVKKGVNALQTIAKNHRYGFSGPIIGITGSCGKTSTKDLLANLLGEKKVLKTAGNLNNYLGVPLTLLRLDNTKHDFGVIEAGINMKNEMGVLADVINADIGIVTMIGRAHLELLCTLESVAKEKADLLRLGKQKDSVIYPASCLKYRAFRNIDSAPNHVLTPIGQELPELEWLNPVHYWCLLDDQKHWNLFLRNKNGTQRQFVIPSLSPGMRQNLALAIFTAGELGVADSVLQERILNWYPSDNRGQVLRTQKNWIYSDCYNANPDSMRDSLEAFRSTFDEMLPRLYVLGSMYELGDDSSSFHREVTARIDLRATDRVICVGKYAADYCAGLKYSAVEDSQIYCCEEASMAAEQIREFEGAVFLKGSRLNRLETLIPSDAKKIVLESGKLC